MFDDEIAKKIIEDKEKENPNFQEEPAVERSLGQISNNLTGAKDSAIFDDMPDIGWKNIPIENLPTQGLFYPDTTTMSIRAASVAEIRHFSTIDDNDYFNVTDMLNMIIEKCCRIKMPNIMGTFRDLKEADRFYLIFCIRDLTFKDGENKLYMDVQDPQDGSTEKIEITKDKFSYYKIDERIMKYYSPQDKCFIMKTTSGVIPLYVPSVGISNFCVNFIRQKIEKREYYDKAFIKLAPFIFPDWRKLNNETYKKGQQDSMGWDSKKISIISGLVEKIELGVSLEIMHICKSGAEVTAPLQFPGGARSLFLISDIFDELL